MKENKGFIGIGNLIQQPKIEKKKTVLLWQELAIKIISELRIEQKDKSFIFKICKQYPYPYVEHCFNETKELARGDKAGHYFVKLVYKK